MSDSFSGLEIPTNDSIVSSSKAGERGGAQSSNSRMGLLTCFTNCGRSRSKQLNNNKSPISNTRDEEEISSETPDTITISNDNILGNLGNSSSESSDSDSDDDVEPISLTSMFNNPQHLGIPSTSRILEEVDGELDESMDELLDSFKISNNDGDDWRAIHKTAKTSERQKINSKTPKGILKSSYSTATTSSVISDDMESIPVSLSDDRSKVPAVRISDDSDHPTMEQRRRNRNKGHLLPRNSRQKTSKPAKGVMKSKSHMNRSDANRSVTEMFVESDDETTESMAPINSYNQYAQVLGNRRLDNKTHTSRSSETASYPKNDSDKYIESLRQNNSTYKTLEMRREQRKEKEMKFKKEISKYRQKYTQESSNNTPDNSKNAKTLKFSETQLTEASLSTTSSSTKTPTKGILRTKSKSKFNQSSNEKTEKSVSVVTPDHNQKQRTFDYDVTPKKKGHSDSPTYRVDNSDSIPIESLMVKLMKKQIELEERERHIKRREQVLQSKLVEVVDKEARVQKKFNTLEVEVTRVKKYLQSIEFQVSDTRETIVSSMLKITSDVMKRPGSEESRSILMEKYLEKMSESTKRLETIHDEMKNRQTALRMPSDVHVSSMKTVASVERHVRKGSF